MEPPPSVTDDGPEFPEPDPLGGLRVLDLTTGRAGAYAARLLADAGADVVLIEGPEGAPLRRYGATPGSVGLLFAYLRGGARSLALDIAEELDAATVARLYATTDVVLEDRGPGRLAALGLGPEALAAANPAAVMVSISPFGAGGPWSDRPGNEFTVQALAGATATRGLPGREYVHGQGRVGEWLTGVAAAVAALAVHRRASATGEGDHVDLSMLEAVTPTCTNLQTVWGSFTGEYDTRRLVEIPSIEPTADGYVGFCVFTGQQWQDFCVLIGRPDLADDPELATMGGRTRRGESVLEAIRSWTTARTTAEVIDAAVALRIPVTPIGNGALLPTLDHLVERGVYRRDPTGRFLQPRPPYRLDDRAPPEPRPVPEPGHHTRQVLAEAARGSGAAVGRGTRDRTASADEPALTALSAVTARDPDPPLAGLRVLDLTQFWAGPYAGFLLAGLGAEVIHVESVQRPDGMRFGSARTPTSDQWWEWGPTFAATNLAKRSVTLDLRRPEGRDLLRRLVERCDALIENYAPRVIDQFGLDRSTVASWNPELVMVRMPAFGLDGPWRDRVGFAQTMEQLSGMSWVTGYRDSPPLLARGPADPLAGLHAAWALLVALARRRRTGRGSFVEATMIETALVAAAEQVIEHSATGELLTRSGNDHPDAVLQACVPCADQPEHTTGWLAVSAETHAQHDHLLDVLAGQPLVTWAAERTLHEAVEALHQAGVPAAPVSAPRLADRHPQHDARGFYVEVDHPVAGRHRYPTLPFRLVRTPGMQARWTPAPTLGQHNHDVLGGLLGLSPDELAALEGAEVIGTRPAGA